jgi:hypothetical protein
MKSLQNMNVCKMQEETMVKTIKDLQVIKDAKIMEMGGRLGET